MSELVVELGCEELPASAVEQAYSDLRDALVKACQEAGILGSGEIIAVGTPRRLIVAIPDVRARQEDQVKEQRGPALKAAYDHAGNPSPALLGFCRSNGVDPAQLRRDEQYVWVDKHVEGRPAGEILAEAIPKAIRGLSFDKTMRWGSSRMRFARPIRWIVALLDGEVVPFEIESVASGNRTRGHRFYAPAEFEISSYGDLVEKLRANKVEVLPEKRREMIMSGVNSVSGAKPEVSDALLDENVFLTEWPNAVLGEFGAGYLELPDPVLTTAMAKHEKMFPVRDNGGKLVNKFVFVRNAGEAETVAKGAEWVLNARFNDAKFFFDEDKKSSLDEFLAKTANIVFAEKLGTVRQRADRLAALGEAIAAQTGGDKSEQVIARNAGLYAKADLSTGLVSEMSSLQGVIGGEYAKREGMLDEVGQAIAGHYDLDQTPTIQSAGDRAAVRLLMADQLDKLAGYLGIGLSPTGSSDPYGLRRAVTMLIEAAWRWPDPLPSFIQLFDLALDQYEVQKIVVDRESAAKLLVDIFASRYEALMTDMRYDIRDAAMLPEFPNEITNPQRVRLRANLLTELAKDIEFVQTATRPINIIKSARTKQIAFSEQDPLSNLDVAALESVDAAALYTVVKGQQEALDTAVAQLDGATMKRSVLNLASPINQFFESTMVMAEQEDIRTARLTLVSATSIQLLAVGDFSKLVIDGA